MMIYAIALILESATYDKLLVYACYFARRLQKITGLAVYATGKVVVLLNVIFRTTIRVISQLCLGPRAPHVYLESNIQFKLWSRVREPKSQIAGKAMKLAYPRLLRQTFPVFSCVTPESHEYFFRKPRKNSKPSFLLRSNLYASAPKATVVRHPSMRITCQLKSLLNPHVTSAGSFSAQHAEADREDSFVFYLNAFSRSMRFKEVWKAPEKRDIE